MLVLEKISKYKNSPVCIIFNGATVLGVELSKLLIEQRAFVILIDEYTEKKKVKVSEIFNEELFSFVDRSGTDAFVEQLPKVDYVFYLNHDGNDPYEDVSTSDFLEKSNQLDKLLQLATEKEAKFLLTSSIKIHKALQSKRDVSSEFDLDDDNLSYTVLEVQRYAENLTWEYHKKGDLDARILRVGELLGEGVDLERNTVLYRFIRSAISGTKIDIEGDGLENLYLVHIKDAAYGLIKGLFTSKTNGNVYSLFIPRDITVLNLAYKILDLEPRAEGINFVNKESKEEMNLYKPAQNLKTIGWKPKISFERALASTIDYAYKIFGKKREVVDKEIQQEAKIVKMKKDTSQEVNGKKRRSLKDFFTNFFFEVKEEKRPRSVLDNVQYKSTAASSLPENEQRDKNIFLSDRKKGVDLKAKKAERKLKLVNPFKGFITSVKSLSLTQFVLYALLACLLFAVYLFLIVPSVRILFFSTKAYVYVRNAEKSLEEYDFSDTNNSLDTACTSLESVDQDIDKLSYLSFLGIGGKIESMQKKVSGLRKSLGASRSVFQELSILERYLESYESNVVLDGTDNLKIATNPIYDLSSLDGLDTRIGNLDDDFLQSADIFDQGDYELTFIGNYIETLATRDSDIKSFAENANTLLGIAPLMLATQDEQTYVLLLLDDSDLKTKGGSILSVAVFSILNGTVTDISVYSASEFSLKLTSQEEKFVRDDLKLLYPEEGLKFEDLTVLFDDDIFTALVESSIESTTGKKCDHIISLNKSALSDLLAVTGQITMANSSTLTSSNMTENFGEEDFSYKELTAKVLEALLRFDKEKAVSLFPFVRKSLENKNLVLYPRDGEYNDYLVKEEVLESEEGEDYFGIGHVLILQKGELPQIEAEAGITFKNLDATVEYKFNFKATEGEGFEGEFVLLNDSSFKMDDVTASSDQLNLSSSYSDKIFIDVKLEAGSEESVTILGTAVDLVSKSDNQYNSKLFLKKPLGYVYYLDFKVDLGDHSIIVDYPEGFLQENSLFTLTEYVTQDQLFEFTYRVE